MVIGIKDTNLYAHPETPDRRAALAARLRAATGLDEAALEAFLRAFYGAARRDPLLGPAFAGVADWEAHIDRLTQFWCSVALMAGTYHGQPMQAHAHLGLGAAHFARWLALFEQTAAACLPPAGAAHLMERARRIAASLEMGLTPLSLPNRTSKGVPA
jgi:hemoglobin